MLKFSTVETNSVIKFIFHTSAVKEFNEFLPLFTLFRHTGIPGLWTQELDAWLWTLDSGHWTLDAGLWTLDPGRWTLDIGFWMLDSEPWTLNSRHWTPDAERWTVDVKTLKFKTVQCFGNNGSIQITSFLNSALIKIFGHFRYENFSTVYSFQTTLSHHLKISENWWCREGRSTWNGLISSFVCVKAKTMSYVLAVNFFHFLKHVVGQKKWFIWIRTLQLLPQKRKI